MVASVLFGVSFIPGLELYRALCQSDWARIRLGMAHETHGVMCSFGCFTYSWFRGKKRGPMGEVVDLGRLDRKAAANRRGAAGGMSKLG